MTEKKQVQRKRKRRKRGQNYFTKEHENAIVQYALTDDKALKSKLYKEFIGPVLKEMVDKIIHTYRFNNLPNIEVLSEDCQLWLVTILNKYKVDKNRKAFSYFTVVTKHYFIDKIKKNKRALNREVRMDAAVSEIDEGRFDTNPSDDFREQREFWMFLWKEIDKWEDKMNLKETDKLVYQGIRILLENSDDIEVFHRKAILLYLREITKLNTKQIVSSMKKMEKLYKEFKFKWDNDKIDGT